MFLSRYVRIISGCLAFWYYEDSSRFFVFYFISYFLDCIDGYAARYLNQATRFGQMLDMVVSFPCFVSDNVLKVLDRLRTAAALPLYWQSWHICTPVRPPSDFFSFWLSILPLITATYILRFRSSESRKTSGKTYSGLAQLLSGESSHKKLSDDETWLLKIYYRSQLV